MKIAFTTDGNSLEATIEARFGRCKSFLILDTDNDKYELIENEASFAGGGAGIKAAQTLINNGVEVVITGNVGPNAYKVLSSSNIKIHTGVQGIISDAYQKFKEGNFGVTNGPTVNSHHGL